MSYQRSFLVALIVMTFSLFGTQAYAQIISACGSTVVASGCVGECGESAEIEYEVGPICPSAVVNLCVRNDSSNLCASHGAFAYVYVNGSLVASGNITTVGSTISFSAKCGSKVKVIVKTKVVNPNINCIVLGNLNFSLRI